MQQTFIETTKYTKEQPMSTQKTYTLFSKKIRQELNY